jgi:hypothetical protein
MKDLPNSQETPEKTYEDCGRCGYCLHCVRAFESASADYLMKAFDYESRRRIHVS